MKVLLVTSWGQPFCGIQAHSENLIAAVQQADPGIEILPSPDALDPAEVSVPKWGFDVVHLNYHRALHSRWTPARVDLLKAGGYKVVITWHDSYGETPPDSLSQDLCALTDAFIVHEPCQGLEKAIYWRMGVPSYEGTAYGGDPARFMLGTVGFDFPWKNYTELAKLTGEIGWGFLICCPEMYQARQQELRTLNPWLRVEVGLSQELVIAALRGCDATAFMFTCGNSGQSASILLGIAARKPVYALNSCRQFRSLYQNDLGGQAIRWVGDFVGLQQRLMVDRLPRLDPWIVRLAEKDSWEKLGRKYAALYQSLQ